MNVFDQAKEDIAEMIDLAVWIAAYDAAVMDGKSLSPLKSRIYASKRDRYFQLRRKYLGEG